MKYSIIILSFFFFISNVFGQVEYLERLEIELSDGYFNETVIEFNEKGLILQSRKGEKEGGNEEWRFDKYDTDLKKVGSKKILVDKKFFMDESFSNDDRHFNLFKNRKNKFILSSLDVESMDLTKVQGDLPKKAFISNMAVLGDYAYFKASVKRDVFLFAINWKTGKSNLIPIKLNAYDSKDIRVQNFQILEEANEILLYVVGLNSRKESDMHVLKLDANGKKVGAFNLTKKIKENIADISAYKLNDEQYIFTGTYSKTSITGSQGLFFCQTSNNKVDFIEFYNFLDLDEFLSYLPKRREAKIEKKKEKKEAKGKEIKFNYRIADHDIIDIDDGYIFVGEAYYPTYRTEYSTTYTTINGVSTPRTQSRRVFDGYQYTHAVIAKFDKKGQLIWDRTIEMYQAHKPLRVKKFLNISSDKDKAIKLAYSSNYSIVSKYIDYNGVIVQEQESEEIEMGYDGDKAKWSSSELSYWYGDYFIASGKQKIKNKEDRAVSRKRKVLFMSKVKY